VPDEEVRASLAFRLATRTRIPAWLKQVPFAEIPLTAQASFVVYRVVSRPGTPQKTTIPAPSHT